MAFQIKDFSSVTASLINWMRSAQKKITDFNVGSVIRTMLEAIAAEIDELYQQMFSGLREAIPVSVYNSFDFPAIPAIPASGMIEVTIQTSATSVVISQGTVFSPASGGVTYQSLQNVTISPGGNVASVAVAATVAGLSGNIPAETVFTLSPSPTGFVSAENPSPFINGVDQESDESRKVRFRDYIQSLSRGTTSAILYGLRQAFLTDAAGNQIERVVNASLVEPWILDDLEPVGLVNCYVYNGIGSTSSALVARAREVVYGYYDVNNNPIPGWKAAGTKAEVAAATETAVAVTGVITPLAGYDGDDLADQATDAITAYIQKLNIGEAALKAEIYRIGMNIPGVYNFAISAPSADTSAAISVKLIPGTMGITAA